MRGWGGGGPPKVHSTLDPMMHVCILDVKFNLMILLVKFNSMMHSMAVNSGKRPLWWHLHCFQCPQTSQLLIFHRALPLQTMHCNVSGNLKRNCSDPTMTHLIPSDPQNPPRTSSRPYRLKCDILMYIQKNWQLKPEQKRTYFSLQINLFNYR